jgi:hypothetical protein
VVHELDQTLRDPGVQHHLDIMVGTVRDVGETPPGTVKITVEPGISPLSRLSMVILCGVFFGE